MLLWRLGNETVRGFAWKINELRVSTGFIGIARMTGHGVRVHIDGIDWIADGDFVFRAKDVENVAAIAFRTIADKYFVIGDLAATITEIILRNCMTQPFVTLFRSVAFECFA